MNLSQALINLTNCAVQHTTDDQKKFVLAQMLVYLGVADETLKDQDEATVLSVAQQYVVANCGAAAWEAPA